MILILDDVSTLKSTYHYSDQFYVAAVKNFTRIAVSEYGYTEGDVEIMSEIYARGPVSIYLNADCLKTYTGGVSMYDSCVAAIPNHVVQINGWGTEGGVDYWIGIFTFFFLCRI